MNNIKLSNTDKIKFFNVMQLKGNNIYNYSQKYFELNKLPQKLVEKIAEYMVNNSEIENSSYTGGENLAFTRFDIEINNQLLNCELSLGSVDIRHSDYNYCDENSCYIDEDCNEMNEDEYSEQFLKDLLSVIESENLTVYVKREAL